MKILKIIHGYLPDYNAGSEVYSQSICDELSKQHQISIFTREENIFVADYNIKKEKETESLIKYFVNLPREKDGYRHPKLDTVFAKLIDETQPDVAHIGHLNHLSTGIVDELQTKNIPIVFTLHDFWLMCPRGQFLQTNFAEPDFYQLCSGQQDQKCAEKCYKAYFSGRTSDLERDIKHWTNWIRTRMEETRAICEKIQLFIAPSRYLQYRFIDEFGLAPEKVIYCDYGFPTQYLTAPQREKDIFTFGYIGTHIPAKGIYLLVKAFSSLKGKAQLRIWGRNNGQGTKSLKLLVKQLSNSMPGSIEWMGEYANHNIVSDVFAKTDVVVVPSIWGENSPLVIHEAQACRIPVITADYGGMKEYVQNRVNGLLFEHRNANSLAEKMQYALENPNQMKELGNKGYLHSEDGQVISVQEHCKSLVKIYQKVISQGV